MSKASRYAKAIEALPHDKQIEVMKILQLMEAAESVEAARSEFMPFVKKIWPRFIEGAHHKIMADAFNRIADGSLKRLIINMPPRHTKSEFASYLFPAWFLGRYPDRQIIQASNNAELAQGFGRKVRNLLQSDPAYREIFPNVKLRPDSTAAGRWNTSAGGIYYAVGVDSDVAGRGADLLVIDDPHGETEALAAEAGDHSVYDKAYEWYGLVRQRLQPGGAIVQVATRWSQRDLTARLIKADEERGKKENWEIIELPAILPSGKALWPQYWPIAELEVLRDGGIPAHRWSAQYQQSPSSGAIALVKRDWWREWTGPLPKVEFVIQSWDTAYSMSNRADYSACTTWGVFTHTGAGGRDYQQLILLDSFRARMEFPDLKRKAYELYRKWSPDTCIIEASAAGTPLVYELRQMGLPVMDYVPQRRANDKILRVNSISDLFSAGSIWYAQTPENMLVIDEFAEFPVGEHDDLVDSATQALIRYRQGGAIRLPSDEDDPDASDQPKRNSLYYRV